MTARWIFDFETARFQRAIAHEGSAPIEFARVLDRSLGSSCNWLDLVNVPIGADIGLHTHGESDEELYIVIDGCGEMTLDGFLFEVGPGSVIVNRPGGAHSLRNTGSTPLRLVVVDVERRE